MAADKRAARTGGAACQKILHSEGTGVSRKPTGVRSPRFNAYSPPPAHRYAPKHPWSRKEPKMNILLFLSSSMMPLTVFFIIAWGMAQKCPIYESFIKGAKDGFHTVLQIMPTLIGLMTAVGVLRASGFLDMVSKTLGSLLAFTGFPAEAVPYVIVRLFSSSAATSLVLDIFKTKGPDSHVGMLVSVLAGCTETVFYTMSVYFMSIKVTKTRYTLAGALTATAAGIAASVFLVQTL